MKALRRSAIAAVALAAALTLSACGSDDMDTAAETTTEQATAGTIVDVAVGAGNFTTLVAAVTAADLATTLSGTGPFTVFAPTNAAFDALPAGTVDGLLKPEKKADLAGVLTYHVVAGALKAADLTDGMELTTVQGGKLKVSIKDGVVMVGDAQVTTADVISSNGVTHVINKVLLPK